MMKSGMRALLLVVSVVAAASTVNCGGGSRSSGGKGGSGGGGIGGGQAGSGAAGRGGNGGGGSGGGAGQGGNAGTGGGAGIGGQSGGGGGSTGGAGGAAGQAGAGGIGGAAGTSGVAGTGGATGVDAGVDAVTVDAGADCIAPSGEAPLDAATMNIPTSGLVLWLRGDRGVHKTAANAVCAWVDQSGHGTIFTPYGGRPSWSATGIAGLPALRPTTAGEGLSTSGALGIAPTSARTIIAVVQLVSATQRFNAVYQGQANTPGTYLGLDANTYNTAGSREGVYMMNNAYDSALATTTAAPRVHVYTIQTMTVGMPVLPSINYRVDGATQTLTRTSGGLGNGNFENFSTANYTSVVSGRDGYVAEVLFYDRALSVSEAAAVELALKARYGLGQ